ncbi:MAG: SCP2 sterol-binding domain-containing protein [Acidimicrobiia bacterium]
MAQFLTQDWLSSLTEIVNSHDGFKNAIANVDLTLQFEVTDAPEETENHYYIAIAEGVAKAVAGDADEPDATITNNYETATAISKGELNTQMAFMTGKLKVSGNMAKLMMNQAMLTQFAEAASGLDVEY